MFRTCFKVSFALVFLFSCTKSHPDPVVWQATDARYQVWVSPRSDTTFQLVSIDAAGDTGVWPLNYPVYQFQYADIDHDGENEMLVGVIKSTRFDPNRRRRLFVFKHVEEQIRPQWLGTRLGMPLAQFYVETEHGRQVLTAIEIEKNGAYAVAKYRWQGFGFEFLRYEFRNQNQEQIKQLGYAM